MIRITATLEGDVVVDRELAGIAARATDMTPVWPEVVAVFRTIVHEAFASEGASTGVSWPQLAAATRRDRVARGFSPAHPILKRTGELERSLTGGGGGFVEPSAQSLAIGSNDPIFPYHQSNKPRRRLPRRAPVLLTPDDRTALVHPIRLHLTDRDPFAPSGPRAAS